jgi:hypothetical protein
MITRYCYDVAHGNWQEQMNVISPILLIVLHNYFILFSLLTTGIENSLL